MPYGATQSGIHMRSVERVGKFPGGAGGRVSWLADSHPIRMGHPSEGRRDLGLTISQALLLCGDDVIQ